MVVISAMVENMVYNGEFTALLHIDCFAQTLNLAS